MTEEMFQNLSNYTYYNFVITHKLKLPFGCFLNLHNFKIASIMSDLFVELNTL